MVAENHVKGQYILTCSTSPCFYYGFEMKILNLGEFYPIDIVKIAFNSSGSLIFSFIMVFSRSLLVSNITTLQVEQVAYISHIINL